MGEIKRIGRRRGRGGKQHFERVKEFKKETNMKKKEMAKKEPTSKRFRLESMLSVLQL